MADERERETQTQAEQYDKEKNEEKRHSWPQDAGNHDEPMEGHANADESEATVQSPVEEMETNWEQVAQDRYDQLVRLQADFDNYRRRVDREREELRGYVTGAVLGDFLPVYDNLERALKYMPDTNDAKPWRMGVEMTLKGFNEILAKLGVTPIPAVGSAFDPRVHEAVQRVDSDEPEGTILEELLKGFQLKDRVLRASMVKVSAGQGTPDNRDSESDSAS